MSCRSRERTEPTAQGVLRKYKREWGRCLECVDIWLSAVQEESELQMIIAKR